jgi:nucleotide-binding universal stress UspA family protein
MKKILVAIDGGNAAWEALSHACSLAKRIDVQLNVLLVNPPDRKYLPRSEIEVKNEIRKKLGLLIEAAKAEGIKVNYYISEGNYEDEVISFINNNKITLLVYETLEGDMRPAIKESTAALRSLRHRVACTIEVVAPKKSKI